MTKLLRHPASTHALFVGIAAGTVSLLALAMGQVPTLAIGTVTVLLAVTTAKLLGADETFTYRTLSGVVGTLALSVVVPVTLVVAVAAGVTRYDGLGIVLSSVTGLLLVGTLGLTLWRAVPAPERSPFGRMFRSLGVSLTVLFVTALFVFFTTNPGGVLSPFVAEPTALLDGTVLRVLGEQAWIPLEVPVLWVGSVVSLAVLDAYLLRFLLARPLVVRVRVWTAQRVQSAMPERESKAEAATDEEETELWLEARLPPGVPFWHYTPAFTRVAAAVGLGIIVFVLGTVLGQVIGNWPATQDLLVLARGSLESMARTLESVAGPPSVVFDAGRLAVALTVGLVVESLARRFVHSGWQRYVSSLGWTVPSVTLAALGVAGGDAVVRWVLDTPAVHYYVVARDGLLLSVESDSIGVERIEPAAIDVSVVKSSELFVPLVEDLAVFYGEPVLLLAPVLVVVILTTCLLGVGRWLVLPVLQFTADRADVSVLLLMAALVLAALAGGDQLLVLAACGGIFLLVDVDGLAQQYRAQFDPEADILRGQFVHVLGVSLVLAGGVAIAWLSGRPSFRSAIADLPRWRVLGGLVLAMALVSLVLYTLRARVSAQEPQAIASGAKNTQAAGDTDTASVDVADD